MDQKEAAMNRLSCFATTVAVASTLTAGGWALGAATAYADPYQAPPNNWCPGQAKPFPHIRWDESVCHTWYTVPAGTGNVLMVDLQGNPVDSWISADIPAPAFTPPPPPPPAAPHPFCTPRGAFIIIPPICDEIGVDIPPGSVKQ
jgi:hypothetical protein